MYINTSSYCKSTANSTLVMISRGYANDIGGEKKEEKCRQKSTVI